MQKKLALILLSLSGTAAMAHSTSRPHPKLPTSEAVQEAIAQFSAVDGAISNLVAIADGETGGEGGEPSFENDFLARNVLLIMSRKTEATLDKLDELDGHISNGDIVQALLTQKEACQSLEGIKRDNIGARAAADAINVGSLTSSLPDFDLIDETVDDTKATVRCP